jgi:hypothetical protein
MTNIPLTSPGMLRRPRGEGVKAMVVRATNGIALSSFAPEPARLWRKKDSIVLDSVEKENRSETCLRLNRVTSPP